MTFLKISPKPYKEILNELYKQLTCLAYFPEKCHFQKVLPSLKVEMTFFPQKCHFQKVLSFLKVETHFQTSCPTSAKCQVHAFLIVLLSHLHTELFQHFLNQKLTISLHGLCDIVRYILRKQTYHKECSDILASILYAQSIRSTKFPHWSGCLMLEERPRDHE